MDKESFFILNIFLNSLLAFFTAAALIELIIFLFRIKPSRMAALLRMIPILKLPIDIGLYDFSKWSYIHGINPLHCEEGSRMLSILLGWTRLPAFRINSAIQFTVLDDKTFTIPDIIGYRMNPIHLKIVIIALVGISLSLFIRKLVAYWQCTKQLRFITTNSEPSIKKIRSHQIIAQIKKQKYPVLTSPLLQGSPFVAGLFSPTIYIPSRLSTSLSGKEFEAVLAHEIEHIRNRDLFIRVILDAIASIFWWVPTKWLRNKIEESQEISCDSKCRQYGVNPLDLASAIYKSAKYAKDDALADRFAYHLTQHKTLNRVKMLTQQQPKRFQTAKMLSACIALPIAVLLILLGRFWVF